VDFSSENQRISRIFSPQHNGTESAVVLGLMPTTTTSAELSLINGNEFLEELRGADRAMDDSPIPAETARTIARELYASLDRELPVYADAEGLEPLYVDRPSAPFEPYDEPVAATPQEPEPVVSMVAAAIVIAMCLSVGAATAAYMFHDSLTRITALRSASR
jgi:hypothetical protein